MTKKYFAQPEMMVVNISKKDIIATSDPNAPLSEDPVDPVSANAPERTIWDIY